MSQTRFLGHSGLPVSVVGLGTNNFGGRLDQVASARVIDAALDFGVTLFDTADVYGNQGGSERILGQVLGNRRSQVLLATKAGNTVDAERGWQGASRGYLFKAVDASLQRLQTDWIDLFQIHRPDPATPIDETVRALADLVQAGKIRYLGLSNFAPWQIVEAQRVARELGLPPFIASQDEYSLLHRAPEAERIPVLQAYGLGLLPYFPLANGLLTGKYQSLTPPAGSRLAVAPNLAQRYLTPERLQQVERLQAFADSRGHSLLQLAFGWLAAQPVVGSIIAGASSAEQIALNVQAAETPLSAADLAEIDLLLQ